MGNERDERNKRIKARRTLSLWMRQLVSGSKWRLNVNLRVLLGVCLVVLCWLGFGYLGGRRNENSNYLHKNAKCLNHMIVIGAGDGEEIANFVITGGSVRDWMSTRGLFPGLFCISAYEADDQYTEDLRLSSQALQNEVISFQYRVGVVVSDQAGTFTLNMPPTQDKERDSRVVRNYVVYNYESNLENARQKTLQMVDLRQVVRGSPVTNGGVRIVHIRSSINDAAAYLRLIISDRILCRGVNKVLLSVRDMKDHLPHKQMNSVTAHFELEILVNILNNVSGCAASIQIDLDPDAPEVVGSTNSLFYSMLAGSTTIPSRVCPAGDTWMRSLPHGSLGIFTDREMKTTDKTWNCLSGHAAVIATPIAPKEEMSLYTMQSWSHLVRVRGSWDLFMKDDPSMEFLVLLDDDAFPFTDTLSEVVGTCMNSKNLQWAGALEKVRIDNGDGGKFGELLRNLHLKGGNPTCYFPSEESSNTNGTKRCDDTFCHGCPGIPQGALIVLTRALVESLRPYIEECERETAGICQRCGSQRLYFCVLIKLEGVQHLHLRGVYRHPWRREKHSNDTNYHGYPVSIHGVKKGYKYLHTGFVEKDFQEIYDVVRMARRRGVQQAGDPLVTVEDLDDQISCSGAGHLRKDRKCVASLHRNPTWCSDHAISWDSW